MKTIIKRWFADHEPGYNVVQASDDTFAWEYAASGIIFHNKWWSRDNVPTLSKLREYMEQTNASITLPVKQDPLPDVCSYAFDQFIAVQPEPLDPNRLNVRTSSPLYKAKVPKYDAPVSEQESDAKAHVVRRAKMRYYNGTPFCDIQGEYVNVSTIVSRDSVAATLLCAGCNKLAVEHQIKTPAQLSNKIPPIDPNDDVPF